VSIIKKQKQNKKKKKRSKSGKGRQERNMISGEDDERIPKKERATPLVPSR